jgi:oligopeptide/dipeptide ABC transporter ATP-binding protein
MSDRAPLVEARGLAVEYRVGKSFVRAVNGVDLRIAAGETVALVGESGCGKSTLGRALLGLASDDTQIHGQVLFDGKDLYGISHAKRRLMRGRDMALVFQDPMTRLDPLMSVGSHFRELLRAHGEKADKREVARRAKEALSEVGVPPDRIHLYPHEFSGGMRQRIMIALALLLRPRFLVADEPTTSLDVIVEAQILDLLARLSKERGLATLLITHNLGLVAQAADRVLVMYAGDIAESAPLHPLFERPAHPYTQGLLASTISLATTSLHSIPGSPPDLADPPTACRFHPRCPRARTICATERPPRPTLAPGQDALCWFPGPEGAIKAQAPPERWGPPLREANP